jgi:hypothetical protein
MVDGLQLYGIDSATRKKKESPYLLVYFYTLIKSRSEVVLPGPRYTGGWQADREKHWNSRQKQAKKCLPLAKKWQARLAGQTKKKGRPAQGGLFPRWNQS